MASSTVVIGSMLAFLFGTASLYGAMTQRRRTGLVENTPTETVEVVSMGRSELSGTAAPVTDALQEPFTDEEATYIWFQIEEATRRAVIKTGRAEHGQDKWQVLAQDEVLVPMKLVDDTGEVLVAVEDAPEFYISDENRIQDIVRTWQDEAGPTREFLERYDDIAPTRSGLWGVVDGVKRRYTQVTLPVGETMYVLGATDMLDDGRKVITRDESSGQFIISDRPPEQLRRRFKTETLLLGVAGLVLFTAGFAALALGTIL